jgi:hypothetical protein
MGAGASRIGNINPRDECVLVTEGALTREASFRVAGDLEVNRLTSLPQRAPQAPAADGVAAPVARTIALLREPQASGGRDKRSAFERLLACGLQRPQPLPAITVINVGRIH